MNSELIVQHTALYIMFEPLNTCRADRHMPSYAKKLVGMYNQNGEIKQMLSNK
jgi:hypothetical protein